VLVVLLVVDITQLVITSGQGKTKDGTTGANIPERADREGYFQTPTQTNILLMTV
jgi:hypothetical protein